jgi:hypothetical protein
MTIVQDHELPNELLFNCLKTAQGDRHPTTDLPMPKPQIFADNYCPGSPGNQLLSDALFSGRDLTTIKKMY